MIFNNYLRKDDIKSSTLLPDIKTFVSSANILFDTNGISWVYNKKHSSHVWINYVNFVVWWKYFAWNFKGSPQNILPIHWKIRFLHNAKKLGYLRFKSSYPFLKRPPWPQKWCGFLLRASLRFDHQREWDTQLQCPETKIIFHCDVIYTFATFIR